jgi:hypothetical protein
VCSLTDSGTSISTRMSGFAALIEATMASVSVFVLSRLAE